jgi:ABC-type transport system involved in multi-copper enzyme maturation permease subunit
MVKEFRCRRFGRVHWLLRLVAICALASLGLTYLTTAGTLDWGVETIGSILVILQVALIILITPSLAAVLISGERESGGWQLLQMTPLSPGAILRGKLMSVVWTLALVLLATLPGYVVMIYIEPAMANQVRRVLLCLLLTAVFALAVSAGLGSLFRRTAPATMTAYAALLAICAGTMLVWAGRDAPFGHATVENVLKLNPVAAALSVIDAPGFQGYELIPANWWALGIVSAAMLVLLAVRTWRLVEPH